LPQEPSAGENVLFADQSTVYGGASKSSWLWTMPPDAIYVDGTNQFSQNPMVQFTSEEEGKTITLEVTDSDGYNCSGSGSLNVIMALPGWKEVLPR